MRALVLVVLVASLSACESENQFGKCVGAFAKKDPSLIYNVSGKNLAFGIIFFEAILPPILVITDETFCPTGKKQVAP